MAQAQEQLRTSAVNDSPELDAQLIACHGLSLTRSKVYAFPELKLDNATIRHLNLLVQRRVDGEPICYITGTQEFWSIPLKVSKGALAPRADTEVLVEKALELAPTTPPGYVLDLGTGSGAIAIAMANDLPTRDILAVEYSPEALQLALGNVRTLALHNLQLIRSSWLDCIGDNEAAMVVANPPYLADDDIHLETLRHEPRQALVSGNTGLEDIAHIIKDTIRAAKAGSPLIIEHGYQQGAQVRQLFLDHNYRDIGTQHDLAGHERISFGFVSK